MAFAREHQTRRCMLCTVAAPDTDLQQVLSENFDFHELTHQTPLPFRNEYRTPETLGKDRIANVAGAQALHPDISCIVIDCGTCIKYELLTHDGRYLGGNIAPGFGMRSRAMHVFTARLPEVPLGLPDQLIGDDTVSALQNGAFTGALLEMEGFIRLFTQKTDKPQVVFTGGDATFAATWFEKTHTAVSVEPELTLIGLNKILNSIN